MTNEELTFVAECLNKQYNYPYFKDKYAFDLMTYLVDKPTRINELKQTKVRKIMNKELVKSVLQKSGNGILDFKNTTFIWPENPYYFNITFGAWGRITKKKTKSWYEQVSRPEKNLVMQLNFGSNHNHVFENCIDDRDYFINSGHPVNEKKNSLGWVRMDIDLDGNEVLIEEVQSDWIRDVIYLIEKDNDEYFDQYYFGPSKSLNALKKYIGYMRDYVKIYQEALLSAAIWVIKNELGISNIWYHTFESSKHYKMMNTRYLPPKSMYTTLPEKFLFDRVSSAPKIIQNCKALSQLNRSGKALNFYHLQLN